MHIFSFSWSYLLEVVALGVTGFVSYRRGEYRAHEEEQRARDQRIPWRCEECGASASAPTMESMLFAWEVHDRYAKCSMVWLVDGISS
jgi:hypothetical protein